MKRIFLWVVVLAVIFSGIACRFSPFDRSEPAPTEQVAVPVPTAGVAQSPVQGSPAVPLVSGDLLGMQDILVGLYEQVNPGVVAIQTIGEQGGGLGSGFVWDKSGNIVTNFHVVEGATDLEVDFPSGLKVRGEVVANDLDSDLAVIKVDVPADQLMPLPLGDSDQLRVGQPLVAIGNPFGLSSTMTLGIVSAKGRTLDSIRESPDGGFFTAGDIIQTDAAINPGNSGGPLLNLNGQVIGLNRAIRTTNSLDGEPTNSGIGFAISVNIMKRVIPVLIEEGKYDYPYLGIAALPEISLLEQEALQLTSTSGAYITRIVPGGPAEDAGLRAGARSTDLSGLQRGGDLITAVDGRPVRIFGDLLSYLMTNKSPGDKVLLRVLRGDEELEVELTLGRRP